MFITYIVLYSYITRTGSRLIMKLDLFPISIIKINYGQIGDQAGLFYTTNPVFYTSGNRFVRRTGTFGNLIFSLVPSDNRNARSTCPTSVFTGTGQSDRR